MHTTDSECNNPLLSNDDNDNGKTKRQNSLLFSIHRWIARHGKFVVISAVGLTISVFFIPPLKLGWKHRHSLLRQSTPINIVGQSNQLENQILLSNSQKNQQLKTFHENSDKQQQHTPAINKDVVQIPPCPHSPWKPKEKLQGKCPGDLKPHPLSSDALSNSDAIAECASSCCENFDCVSWQYRSDVGCLQGKDIRLGMEKDGPAAWCSDHPPHKWNGQYLSPHKQFGEGMDPKEMREKACSEDTWNPLEQIGQCFGLGDVKQHASSSAKTCMEECCKDHSCGAWQWNKELGCFYSKGMHGCQGDGGDPVQFEPFEGRRKIVEGRKYTDKKGKPWQQSLDE